MVEGLTLTLLSLSAKQLMLLRTIRMTFNFRFLLIVEMMPSISVPFIWDHQIPNQLELFSTQDRSIWLLPVFFVMMRLLATTSSKSMTHSQEDSSREIKPIRDARPWLMICTNLNQTKSSRRLPRSSPMDQLSSKVSYGRTILASNHSRATLRLPQNNLRLI